MKSNVEHTLKEEGEKTKLDAIDTIIEVGQGMELDEEDTLTYVGQKKNLMQKKQH